MHSRALILLLLLCGGCATKWTEVHNATGDRFWLISEERNLILRCFDMTPNVKPMSQNTPVQVFCQVAYDRGSDDPRQYGDKEK